MVKIHLIINVVGSLGYGGCLSSKLALPPTNLEVLEFHHIHVPIGLNIILGLVKLKCMLCRVNKVLNQNPRKTKNQSPKTVLQNQSNCYHEISLEGL